MPELSDSDKQQINEFLARDEDELYVLISHGIPIMIDGQLALQVLDAASARARGKELYNRFKDGLYERICVQWQYCRRRDGLNDKYALFSTIMTLVAEVLGGFGTVTAICAIVALLMKMGLGRFCKCDENA